MEQEQQQKEAVKKPVQVSRYEIGENLSMVLFVAIVMLGVTLCVIFGHVHP